MEPLTTIDRERIFTDYKEAQEYIDNILSGERANLTVVKPHQYLTPTICLSREPLESNNGELMHYTKIRNALEQVLAGQSTKPIQEFHKAPNYIKERLQTSEPVTSDTQ